MKGIINKIQEYSTKDGPGIRSTVFMKGCNLRCIWCANPETFKMTPDLLYHQKKCQLCGRCVNNKTIKPLKNGLLIDYSGVEDIDDLVSICPFDAYEKIGNEISVKELTDKLILNKIFYTQTDGGVTFSGGEAMLQSDFVSECIDILHQNNISVAVDTAGNIDNDTFRKVANKADLVLYDLKTYNRKLHIQLTGSDNDKILSNYLDIKTDLIVRLIIVPGLNDDMDDIKKRIDFALSNDKLKQIDILKYHNLGVGKYKALGLDYQIDNIEDFDENLLKEITDYLDSNNIRWSVGGN